MELKGINSRDEILGVEGLLKEYEIQFNINIIFACDTGSRALGVSVESSDFDVFGLFVADEQEYLQVVRKSPFIIQKQGIKIKLSDKEMEIDIQLWDIKDWLKKKVTENILGIDFYFKSPTVFRKEEKIIEEILKHINPPLYYFWGKYKNNYTLCQKDILKEGTQYKKLMNMLIYALQYLTGKVYDVFPPYNVFDNIKYIKENIEKLKDIGGITVEDLDNINKCFNFISYCYEEKKKGKKNLTKDIPEFVTNFVNFLDSKLNIRLKKDDLINNWTKEKAQNIFNLALSLTK